MCPLIVPTLDFYQSLSD